MLIKRTGCICSMYHIAYGKQNQEILLVDSNPCALAVGVALWPVLLSVDLAVECRVLQCGLLGWC